MRRKELTIFNLRRSNHETQQALELLQAHAEWFAPLLNFNLMTKPFACVSRGIDTRIVSESLRQFAYRKTY